MKTAMQILAPWMRTVEPKTNITDADWKTLNAMVEKGLADARHAALTEAAELPHACNETSHCACDGSFRDAILALRDRKERA